MTLLVFLHLTKSASFTWLMYCVLHASMVLPRRSLSAGGLEKCKRRRRGLDLEDEGMVGTGREMYEYISMRSSGQCLEVSA